MLESIEIENLAVIKKASINFGENLNVFTGETGAGKSILLNGLQTVLGMRTNREIVRNGCEKAIVIATFSNLGDNVKSFLSENGFLDEDEDTLIIKREIYASGKTNAKINFHSTTISLLKELGLMLVNVHGQHDNQILLSSDSHLKVIDDFGCLDEYIYSYRESFHLLQKTAKKIGNLKKKMAEAEKKRAYLTELVDDISALKIEDELEEERLEKEYLIAQNAEDLITACRNSAEALEGNNFGAIDMIAGAIENISDFLDMKEELGELSKRLDEAKIELKDISEELSHTASDCYIDEDRFEYVKNRLEEFYRLKKKYCCDFGDLIKLSSDAEKSLETMESDTGEISELQEQKKELLIEVSEKAKILSTKRKETSERFSEQITEQLKFLNMENVHIEVAQTTGKLTLNGMDTLEILISANKGEPPKPISKIASGGELSRIMLAIKAAVADKDDVPTMIFDEIDTGVSGKAAQKIGYKLKEIGKKHQVLCVTHLSQIAVMADTHLLIEKSVQDDSTVTNITTLDYDGRVNEIARIMGGENPDSSIIEAAKAALSND